MPTEDAELLKKIRQSDATWFEPLTSMQKLATVRALAATWTAADATDRDQWLKNIRSIADAVRLGLDRGRYRPRPGVLPALYRRGR